MEYLGEEDTPWNRRELAGNRWDRLMFCTRGILMSWWCGGWGGEENWPKEWIGFEIGLGRGFIL